MTTIGITDYVQPPFSIEREVFPDAEFVGLGSEDEHDFDPGQLTRLDALLVWHARISAHTLAHLRKCRIIVRYGVGFDNIDTQAIRQAGIPFCNTPDYGVEEVADTAAAMLLDLHRKVTSYDRACRGFTAGWQEHTQPPIRRIRESTLGIVGMGRIGTALCRRMTAFGYRIVGFDPYQPSGHDKAVGYHRAASLDELLSTADAVSIHCPLTPETRGLIDRGFLQRMKPGAILVNTARGPILADLDIIEAALRNGQLSACGFDVLPQEPPRPHPLLAAWRNDEPWLRGRLLITPHTAYYSESAWREMRHKAAETIRIHLDSGILRNRIA